MKVLRTKEDILSLEDKEEFLLYCKAKKKLIMCYLQHGRFSKDAYYIVRKQEGTHVYSYSMEELADSFHYDEHTYLKLYNK